MIAPAKYMCVYKQQPMVGPWLPKRGPTWKCEVFAQATIACAAHFTLMNLENVLTQGGSNALPATLGEDSLQITGVSQACGLND